MRSRWILAIGLALIALWQTSIYNNRTSLSDEYSIRGTVGGGGHHLIGFREFAEGFKRTGLYPITPDGLAMEIYDTYRMGDRGKMFLLWFDSFFSESNWGYVRASGLFFVFALAVYFGALFWRGHVLFATISTALIGSSSFQLYETYRNENIFSWPISTTILMMGLNAFALDGRIERLDWRHLVLALVSGLALGLIKQVRIEPVLAGAGVAAAYMFLPSVALRFRVVLVVVLLAGLTLTSTMASRAFDALYERTEATVVQNDGTPFSGHRRESHLLWHPVFCGFGDYAEALGYRWDDYAAYAYALPFLRKKEPGLWPEFDATLQKKKLDDYFIASDARYKEKLEDRDDYEPILRTKILRDSAAHPETFVALYVRRILDVFVNTPGVQLFSPQLGKASLNFPGIGLFFFATLFLAARQRDRFSATVLLFSLPLAATSILIYSKNSYSFYSIYLPLTVAVAMTQLFRSGILSTGRLRQSHR